jgi:mono/diheme cytochrome c family protein
MVRTFSLAAVMATAALAVATQATTQQTTPQAPKPTIKHEPARPINSLEGKDTFAAYCATCHGQDAKGHGPAAPALKVPPADLTTIAKRHNGKFSPVDVETKIAGNDLPAHGTSEMPIWGPIFRSISKDRDIDTIRMKNLVKYLESIQEK